MDVANRVRSESNEASGRPRSVPSHALRSEVQGQVKRLLAVTNCDNFQKCWSDLFNPD